MPHSIRIDIAEENLFILRNISYAAKEFAQRHELTVDILKNIRSEHSSYFAWVNTIVGDRLLDIAMTTRLAYDIARDDCKEYGPSAWDREATASFLKGNVIISDVRVSVREICNKIIHAKSIKLERISRDNGNSEEWSGVVILSGDKTGINWKCNFSITSFCDAVEHFLARASEEIDWFRLYSE